MSELAVTPEWRLTGGDSQEMWTGVGSEKDLEPGDEEEGPWVESFPWTPLAKGFINSS